MQKMKYSRNVINEVLRLVPPATGNFKEAISNFTYGNFSIPKGWKVYFLYNQLFSTLKVVKGY
ncbi:hypothetical protein LguiA_001925 [Lonicera macranthoides]